MKRGPMPPEAKANGGTSWKGGRSRRLQVLLKPTDALWMFAWLKQRDMSWGDWIAREIARLRQKG